MSCDGRRLLKTTRRKAIRERFNPESPRHLRRAVWINPAGHRAFFLSLLPNDRTCLQQAARRLTTPLFFAANATFALDPKWHRWACLFFDQLVPCGPANRTACTTGIATLLDSAKEFGARGQARISGPRRIGLCTYSHITKCEEKNILRSDQDKVRFFAVVQNGVGRVVARRRASDTKKAPPTNTGSVATGPDARRVSKATRELHARSIRSTRQRKGVDGRM